MHPLLATRGRITLYLLVWLMLAWGMLGYLLSVTGRGFIPAAGGGTSSAASVPGVCIHLPGAVVSVPRSASVPTAQAAGQSHSRCWVVVALVWIVLAKLLALGLSRRFAQLDQRFSPQLPLLFGIGVLLYLLAVALHYVLLSVESSQEAETRERAASAPTWPKRRN